MFTSGISKAWRQHPQSQTQTHQRAIDPNKQLKAMMQSLEKRIAKNEEELREMKKAMQECSAILPKLKDLLEGVLNQIVPAATTLAMPTSCPGFDEEDFSGYDGYTGLPSYNDPPIYDERSTDPNDPISTLPTI